MLLWTCAIICIIIHIYFYKYIYTHKYRELLFPNLPPAQGHESPSRKLVLPQIDHHFTVGVIYAYIRMYRLPVFYFISHGARINQQFDLLELQRLHRKINRSRTVQIHHSLVAGSVLLSWLNASLLAQRLVVGSICSRFLFFISLEKLSQLGAIELERCVWAGSVLLR